MNSYYVYIYRDPRPGMDMQPIYVGKGHGNRAWKHWRYGADPSNRIFTGKLKQIKDAGLEPQITIINVVDESVAFHIERGLIASYGRRSNGSGTLCNLTDGGEGFAVGRLTDEHRSKIAAALRNYKRTDEHCRNLSIALTGQKVTDEKRAKLVALARQKAADPEFRAKVSASLKGRKLPKELAEDRSKKLADLNRFPERRAQVSQQMKARHEARRLTMKENVSHE